MQALLERAYRMKLVTPESRTKFYKMMNARGWKTNEPGTEFLANEKPSLPTHIGKALKNKGVTEQQAAAIAGYANPDDNPFRPTCCPWSSLTSWPRRAEVSSTAT